MPTIPIGMRDLTPEERSRFFLQEVQRLLEVNDLIVFGRLIVRSKTGRYGVLDLGRADLLDRITPPGFRHGTAVVSLLWSDDPPPHEVAELMALPGNN